MDNVIQISKSQRGFTRMDNELYEALIGADLSGRELRVALAIHRYTAGYNVTTARVPAATIAQLANLRREHVSRMVSELIRQRVIFRAGGSKGPLGISPVSEWRIDPKNEDKKSGSKAAQSAISGTSLVPFPAHIKDRKDITAPTELVAAAAATASEVPAQAEAEDTLGTDQPAPAKQDRIPYAKIVDIYNTVCGGVLPRCLELNEKRRANIRKCWNLKIGGQFVFRTGDFWEGYFSDCLQSAHWTGNNDRGWRAHLEFLTRTENVLRVLEGQA